MQPSRGFHYDRRITLKRVHPRHISDTPFQFEVYMDRVLVHDAHTHTHLLNDGSQGWEPSFGFSALFP